MAHGDRSPVIVENERIPVRRLGNLFRVHRPGLASLGQGAAWFGWGRLEGLLVLAMRVWYIRAHTHRATRRHARTRGDQPKKSKREKLSLL